MLERGPRACQDPCSLQGVGHLKGTDRLTNSPHMDPSPGQVLMKEGWRVLPPGLGGLEGWRVMILGLSFGSLRIKDPEQFGFSLQT